MNVASKDLCLELYELSGWDDCDFNDLYGTQEWHVPIARVKRLPNDSPRYDLGYLLRKLHDGNIMFTLRHTGFYWVCDAGQLGNGQSTDTPEDAAAKLAIELIKRGILHKESA